MENHKIYSMSFGSVYPLYLKKAERKERTKEEVDELITWLTGYTISDINRIIEEEVTFDAFFDNAPNFNENAKLITGVICGVRVEEISHPLMQKIRYLDKIIDELAKGKKLEKILNVLKAYRIWNDIFNLKAHYCVFFICKSQL